MATVTNGPTGSADSSNVTSYASNSFTPADGDVLLACVVATGTIATGTMTDSLALGFTKVTSSTFTTSTHTCYAFVSNSFATASAMTVTFDCTGDAATGAIIMVARVAGLSKVGLAAVRQSGKQDNGAAAATPTVPLGGAALTTNPMIGFLGKASTTAQTPPSGWTAIGTPEPAFTTPSMQAGLSKRDSGETGSTITWGATVSTQFGAFVVEMDASETPTPPLTMAPLNQA